MQYRVSVVDVAYGQWPTAVTGVGVKKQLIRDNKGSVTADSTVPALIISDDRIQFKNMR